MFSFRAFNDNKISSFLWTSILKTKWQNQNLDLIIAMFSGFKCSESMFFIFNKVLKDGGEKVWDKFIGCI